MQGNFDYALGRVLGHEGGFSDHPEDNGGATMWGVTHRTYDAYRRNKGLPVQPVDQITRSEMVEIYRREYWDAVRGDDLPSGVDYAVFDFAVNSGPGRAAMFVQRIVGAEVDGVIGAQTLAAIWERDAHDLIITLCDRRLAWMRTLSDWTYFGRGWTNRVRDLKEDALAMTRGRRMAERPTQDRAPKTGAAPRKKPAEKAKEKAGGLVAAVTGSTGGIGAAIAATRDAPDPVAWAFAAAIVMAVSFFILREWRAEA